MMRYTATVPSALELEIPPSCFVIFSTPGCIYVAISRIAPLNPNSTSPNAMHALNYRMQRDSLSGSAANSKRTRSSAWTPWDHTNTPR
jgi:hypothetical protein